MPVKGLNNNNLKQENRGLILRLIATGVCNTRMELTHQTGLSKMSVCNIINEFMERGIVEAQEVTPVTGKGRNPIILTITKRAPKVIGLDIHRTECVVVLTDLQLHVLKKKRKPLNQENGEQLYQIIFSLIDEIMEESRKEDILGIGVGGAGPVDIKKGMILNPPDFYGLKDLKITETLTEHYQMPVYMDSQYNCGAMAEYYYGVGKGTQDFIFVGLMKGIGSGIVSNGKIYRSANGFTSELGHVSIDWKGHRCSCGKRGCLENYAGSDVIREELLKATGKEQSFREFCIEAQKVATEEVDTIFSSMMEKLAAGIGSIVNITNPDRIIMGHDGYFIPDRYLEQLEKQINETKISGDYRYVKVVKSGFEDEAHIRGCGCVLLDQIFSGKLAF